MLSLKQQKNRYMEQKFTLATFNGTMTNERTQQYLAQVLGEKKSAFVNNVTALVSANEALQQCDPLTVMYAAIKATALNLPLDPNLGFAYVIPFWNGKKGKQEAQFQLGYRGYLQLAMRSGQFRTINVRDVREGEMVDEDFVSGEITFKKREHREELPIIGYVAFMELLNGFRKMTFWTVAEINQHGLRYSQTYANERTRATSKWATDFDAMAKKTVLKLLLAKYAPMSIDMQQAISADQAVLNQNGGVQSYIDNDSEIDVDARPSEQATTAIDKANAAIDKATKKGGK